MTPPVATTDLDLEPTTADVAEPTTAAADADLVADDLLVEEISIDGMCGVY